MIWQILIATITERAEQFELLKSELERQIAKLGLQNEVGILYDCDNREKPIGKKRQDLLERSTATYCNSFDDDDFPYPNYVEDIYYALLTEPDCIGMIIQMTSDNVNPQTCCHSIKFPVWESKKNGYDYVRNCTHFNTVKRELALQIGFNPLLHFGEDKDYSDRITPLCKKEIFIDRPLFHYRYSSKIPHDIKYGIKK